VEVGADGDRVVGIDGAVAFLDVADDAVLVDDDVGAHGPLVAFALDIVVLEDAVRSEHLVVHVAQERKLDGDLLGEGGIRGGTIHAYTENFRITRVDLARIYSRLDRLELFRSTTGEGEDVNGQEDISLAAKIAELDGFPLIAEESEVGSSVADFERDLGYFVFLLSCPGKKGDGGRESQEQACGEKTFHRIASEEDIEKHKQTFYAER